jgi:hypothetical protein
MCSHKVGTAGSTFRNSCNSIVADFDVRCIAYPYHPNGSSWVFLSPENSKTHRLGRLLKYDDGFGYLSVPYGKVLHACSSTQQNAAMGKACASSSGAWRAKREACLGWSQKEQTSTAYC